jgi:hypothetical protein
MNIYSFIIVWERMAKSAEYFASELCSILDKITPLKQTSSNKQILFDTIFKIFEQDAEKGAKGKFWEAVIDLKCDDKAKLKDKLPRIMYRTSNQLFNKKTGQVKYNQVASLLFLELLWDLILKLKDKFGHLPDKNFLENFILLVEDSDTSGVLNIGVDDVNYFLELTTENTEKLKSVIRMINREFEIKKYERNGNYSLAHLIRNYCKGLIGAPAAADDAADDAAAAVDDDWEIVVGEPEPKSKLTVEQALEVLHHPLPLQPGTAFISSDKSSKKICPFGYKCYRINNPEHISQFRHPGDGHGGGAAAGPGALDGGSKQRTKCNKRSTKRRHTRHTRHTRRRRRR